MKRAILIILGILLLILGLSITAAGVGVVVVVGSDGAVDTNAGRVTGTGYALVFNNFQVETPAAGTQAEQFADLTAGAVSTDGQPVFIGVGPSTEVTKYLTGVQRDVVSDISGNSAKVTPIPGTQTPSPPQAQSFWTVSASGDSPTVALDGSGAGDALVIMNSDPTSPVSVDLKVGLKSTVLFPAGIGLVVVGVIFLLLAIWAFVRARKARKRNNLPPGGYPAAAVAAPAYPANPYPVPPATYPAPTQAPPPQPAQPPDPPSNRPSAGGDGPPTGQDPA